MRHTLLGVAVAALVVTGMLWSRGGLGPHAHHGTTATVELVSFFTLGLLGGFGHCVGMCSPFVLFVSRREQIAHSHPAGGSTGVGVAARPDAGVFVAQLWYTAGRILTYAVLGALAGAFGGALETAGALIGVRRAAAVVAGGVLVVWAVVALSDLWRPQVGGRLLAHVAALVKRRVPPHPFATGLLLGLLPCGFLYSAVVAAIARGGPLEGAAALALFGLGTAPALLGVSLADELLARRRMLLNRLSQVFILVMGMWFLWTAVKG